MRELIDSVDCTGTELKLIDCSHSTNLHISYTSPRVGCQYCKQMVYAIELHNHAVHAWSHYLQMTVLMEILD